jgi:hypothetical protein
LVSGDIASTVDDARLDTRDRRNQGAVEAATLVARDRSNQCKFYVVETTFASQSRRREWSEN